MDDNSTRLDLEVTPARPTVKPSRVVLVALATVALCVAWTFGSVLVFNNPDSGLLYAYLPPLVLAAGSLIATLIGGSRWWPAGSILLGTALYWVGLWIFILVIVEKYA